MTLNRGRLRSFCALCTHLSRLSTRFGCKQLRQSTQIHYRRGEREQQLDFRQTAQLHLAKYSVLLCVTEHRLDELAGELTDLISGVTRRASINAARSARGVLRNVRSDMDVAAAFDEGLGIVGLPRGRGWLPDRHGSPAASQRRCGGSSGRVCLPGPPQNSLVGALRTRTNEAAPTLRIRVSRRSEHRLPRRSCRS